MIRRLLRAVARLFRRQTLRERWCAAQEELCHANLEVERAAADAIEAERSLSKPATNYVVWEEPDVGPGGEIGRLIRRSRLDTYGPYDPRGIAATRELAERTAAAYQHDPERTRAALEFTDLMRATMGEPPPAPPGYAGPMPHEDRPDDDGPDVVVDLMREPWDLGPPNLGRKPAPPGFIWESHLVWPDGRTTFVGCWRETFPMDKWYWRLVRESEARPAVAKPFDLRAEIARRREAARDAWQLTPEQAWHEPTPPAAPAPTPEPPA